MGWFWGQSGKEPSKRPETIVDRLDPDIRKLLEDEKFSPPDPAWERERESNERANYRFNRPPPPPPSISSSTSPSTTTATSTQPSSSSSSSSPPTPQARAQAQAQTQGHEDGEEAKPRVPRASLFPDGRFAHIWKTYQSYDSILGKEQTEQDRLRDLVDMYNDRKHSIGKAATENCALEQVALTECMRKGGLAKRMTLCRTEQRAFDRCYVMQSKFLRALGYMAERGREAWLEERLQMHADTLYHRMLEHERLVEEAKGRGEEPPALVPVMSREGMARILADADADADAKANANANPRSSTSTSTNTSNKPIKTTHEIKQPSPPPPATLNTTDMLSDLTSPSESTTPATQPQLSQQPTTPSPLASALASAPASAPAAASTTASSKPPIPTIPALSVQDLPQHLQHELRERLDGLSTEERALEIRLFEEELHSKRVMTSEVVDIYEEERLVRKARRDAGRETVGDRMKRWWGWK